MKKKLKKTYIICCGGILTGIAVLFQSAPVFLPAIGMALSPLSSLPMLLAAIIYIPMGLVVLFLSAIIIFIVSPQEAIIFLLTTGPFGITIGCLLYRKGWIFTLLLSTISLFSGIVILTYIVEIPAFGSLSKAFSLIMILFYLIFSFLYSCLWTFCTRKFISKLRKLGLI